MQNKGNIFNFGFISLLILISFNLKSTYSYVILPLEYLPKEHYKFFPKEGQSETPQLIVKELFYKRLITYLNIGTPLKSQMMLLDTDSFEFFLTSLNPPAISHKENKISDFYQFGENLFYNESQSTSYKEEECLEHEHDVYDEICYSKDKIKFNFGNYTSIIDFPIKVLRGEDERIPGLIGLSVNGTITYGSKNFLTELKLYNLIKDYYYFFDFETFSPINSQIKGNLVIGDLPHNIFPEKYSKEDFVIIKSNEHSSFWSYPMKKIEIKSKTKKDIQITNTRVHTFYEFYHIIGTPEFWNEIRELFINKLIKENKCFVGHFSQNLYSYDDLYFYYCDISVEKILYNNLYSIEFYSKNIDFIFELNKDELYFKKGNYIYFNVLFFEHQYNDWILGQIFTSKYHFVFHTDSRQISFYKKINSKNGEIKPKIINNSEEKDNKRFLTYMVVIAFVFIVIGIIIGIVIGIKFLKNRKKKKAEELVDDDYDYTPKNENNVES